MQYASGNDTLSETTSSVLPFNGFSYRKGKWNFTASIPVIDQDSPFVTYVGGTPVPSGRRQGVEGSSTGKRYGRTRSPTPGAAMPARGQNSE